MEADISTFYESDFYRILDFRCRCTDCRTSKPEYGDAFCISFVRKGNFLFNVFRHSLDSYSGCVLISKPESERTVTHIHTVPDECTILEFTNEFYRSILERYSGTRFLSDRDLHSTLLRADPEVEFLHHVIIQEVLKRKGNRLHIDALVMEVLDRILNSVSEYTPLPSVTPRLKAHHLTTIERAKQYITENLSRDISLMEIAEYCCVSPFHFSRIFKTFTSYSPYQFLLTVRLKHSEILLRNTARSITDIGFSSGFNSLEHFIAAFRKKYRQAPGQIRTLTPMP